jgi:hypothetical protein
MSPLENATLVTVNGIVGLTSCDPSSGPFERESGDYRAFLIQIIASSNQLQEVCRKLIISASGQGLNSPKKTSLGTQCIGSSASEMVGLSLLRWIQKRADGGERSNHDGQHSRD